MLWKTPEERTTYIRNALQKAGLSMESAEKIKGDDEAAVLGEINTLLIADIDRRVNKAVETNNAKLAKELSDTKAALEELKKQPTATQTQTPNGTDQAAQQPDIVKAIQEMLKPVTDRIDAIDRERAQAQRGELVRNALKEAGLNDSLARFIPESVTDPEKIREEVTSLKTSFLDGKSAETNEALAAGRIPGQGGGTSTMNEDTAKSFAATLNKQATGGGDFATADPFAYKNSPSQSGAAKS